MEEIVMFVLGLVLGLVSVGIPSIHYGFYLDKLRRNEESLHIQENTLLKGLNDIAMREVKQIQSELKDLEQMKRQAGFE